jgi:putative hemolysin
MDNTLIELIIFASLILLAGFLEAAEIAISSIGENKIDELKEQQSKVASYFELIQNDQESFFGSLQVIYTFIIILSAIIGFKILIHFITLTEIGLGINAGTLLMLIIAAIVITAVIIVFCLLIPRAIGFKYSGGIAIRSVKLLYAISKLLKVAVRVLTVISDLLLKPFKERTNFSQSRPSEDEILDIISDGVKSGAIDETEQEIIENILEFNDLKADEVMIPRTEMIAVDLTDNNEAILKEIMRTGHSLIPAYEETPDNIIGVIHTKDLMKRYFEKGNVSIKDLVRPAYFIPETKLISEVLKEMQRRGERMAIVTDEYGGTEGLIALEDVLEEIVGEIKDKTKVEISEFSKFPDGTFCILGSMDIEDFNETFNFEIPDSEEYNTIAGFIAEKTGKIMNHGDSFAFGGLHFELIKKIRQKMVQFKVYSKEGSFRENQEEEKN